jgi:flagellar motor switch/type III secretory pathway protein FliN
VRGLEEQDVVLLDDVKPTSNGLHCRLNVGAARSHAGYVMLRKGGQLQMIQFGRIGDSDMSSDTEAPITAEAGFDDIPVSLRFEVAQWNASLAEVSQLAPGAVIDLRQRLDEQAVSVWIEQRCIGKGQLVAIGERLGVRLLSVFTREHA